MRACRFASKEGAGSPAVNRPEKMTIGLTGGIGCGKSTVLGLFRELGAETVETDAIVRDLLARDKDLTGRVAKAFGEGVLDGEGRVDRKRLAATVFANSEALALLERLLHPLVRARWMERVEQAQGLPIVEIPLLFEKDLQVHFTKTICVSSFPEVQMERLQARGMSYSDIQSRKERQLGLDEKMRRADIVLHNNGTLDHLKEQVEWVMKRLAS